MASEQNIVYLAGPYSDPDAQVRLKRFEAATLVAAELIRRGHIVFSPLTMTHPIDLVLAQEGATLGSDYWLKFDVAFMMRCDVIAVIKDDGWRNSSGVTREIAYFRDRGRPVLEVSKSFDLIPFLE